MIENKSKIEGTKTYGFREQKIIYREQNLWFRKGTTEGGRNKNLKK
jgi:hypothetical protein